MAGESNPNEHQDLLFARLAIKKGLLLSNKLESARSLQRELSSRGEHRRLSSLFIQTGDMSASQVRQVLSELETSMISCPGCGANFNIAELPPGKKFLCKRCKTVVVVPGPGGTQATPAPHELARTLAVTRPEEVKTPMGPGEVPEEPDALLGKVLGGCRITKKLGAGGMGAVYLATQISLGRPVALKILPKSLASNEEYIARFEREARAVALLNHPNIVQVHDMGKDKGGFYFIVMEFVDGTTLSDLWKEKGPLDEKFALRAIRQACGGLHAAHEADILHRDIKPENLMISKGGRIKITDFGLAKETKGDSQLTGTGIALGTPAYMPPEQGMGETPDRRSDLYSLGGTLFTLLTAKLPYEAKSPLSMMMKHATEPVPSAREANPAVSELTDKLIRRAMGKAPEDRFKDLDAMRDAVVQCLDALAKPAAAPPPPKKKAVPLKPARKSRTATPPPPKTPTPKPARKTPASPSREEKKKPRKGAPLTPKTPQKAAGPHRKGAGRGGAKKEDAARSGARKIGKKSQAAIKSGRHQVPARKEGKGKLVAVLGGGGVVLLLLVLVVALVVMNKGNATGGDEGGSTRTSPTSKEPEPEDTPPDEGSDDGETRTRPPEDTGETGGGTPPEDEPEGPINPPQLPHGIRKGDRSGEYINKKDGSILVYVPAGRVRVGMTEEDLDWIRSWFPTIDLPSHRAATPAHSVYMPGFFIGKFEVTNGQYELYLDWIRKNRGKMERYLHPDAPDVNTPLPNWWGRPGFSDMDAPVVGIDWYDAWAYAHWAGLDLPTETQWEKAALWDPAKRERRRFPWGERVDPRSAYCADRSADRLFSSLGEYWRWRRGLPEDFEKTMRPVPVRSSNRDTSAVGAVGMCGNVAEWCRDNFHHHYFRDADASQRNAYNPAYYPGRSVRGGHYKAPLEKFFPRCGYYAEDGVFTDTLGFRCVKHLEPLPDDILKDLGEPELRRLALQVRKRTVMGLLEAMKREKNWNGVAFRAKWALDAFPEEEVSNFYFRLGQALMEKDKINDAVYYFESGVNLETIDTRRAEFHLFRGRALMKAGDHRGALAAINKSIELNPHQFNAHYDRGKFRLEKAKKFKEAVLDFKKALEYVDSADAGMALHGIGLCKKNLDDFGAAFEFFSLALRVAPDNYNYRYDRGNLYLMQKNWEKAGKDFQKLIDQKSYSPGYLGLARAEDRRGNPKEALRIAERGLNAKKTSSRHYRELQGLRDEIKRRLGK